MMARMYSSVELLSSEGLSLICSGSVRLVEKEGLTPHQALEALERMKSTMWFMLNQIKEEKEK
ncbi:hypothetical protein [Bacillus inaquosorum]|uniref:hypothetical protein n=2 Tax=Bacillus inaquosorum TaxID=483913 RepID=UPI00398FB7E8